MIPTGEPRTDSLMRTLEAHVLTITDYNDPRCTHSAGGRTGKPGSRPPGRQQCPGAVRELERILSRACKDAEAAARSAKLHEFGLSEVENVGGVDVRIPAVHAPVRRKDGTFAEGNPGRPGARLKMGVLR